MKKKTRKIKKETTFGDEVLHSLNDFVGAVERGERITIRTLKLSLHPAEHGPDDVKLARRVLGHVSQAIFAQLFGVSVKTVQSWEQGERQIPGPARRLLDDINTNTEHWANVIKGAIQEQLAEA